MPQEIVIRLKADEYAELAAIATREEKYESMFTTVSVSKRHLQAMCMEYKAMLDLLKQQGQIKSPKIILNKADRPRRSGKISLKPRARK